MYFRQLLIGFAILTYPLRAYCQQSDAPVGVYPCGSDTTESVRPDFSFIESGIPGDQVYSIRVVEVAENQTAEQALAQNIEVVALGGLGSGLAPFGPALLSLKPATLYCWQVTAQKKQALKDQSLTIVSKSKPCTFITPASKEQQCRIKVHARLPRSGYQYSETNHFFLEPSPLLSSNAVRIELCLTGTADTTATYACKARRKNSAEAFAFDGPRIGRGTSRSYDARVYDAKVSANPVAYFRLVLKR